MNKFFNVENLDIRPDQLFFILGPCVIESEQSLLETAATIQESCAEVEVPFIFKASFQKANRSSLHSYQGPGLEAGLSMMEKVKKTLNIPVLSDIHETWQAQPAAEVLSVIQIPAFLCRQTELLLEAGRTGLPINVKKGQFMAAEDMSLVIEKIKSTGNQRIFLTERGTFFGYRNLVVDFRNIPLMKANQLPVIMDATHSVQRPSAAQGISGGNPEYIPLMAAAGVVSGANGIFIETHPNPDRALSDGLNSLPLKNLKSLLFQLKKLYNTNS